ncbi:hypothetical protein [Streptomyces noursei]|uniref:Uncharacterized protein n=1 Tax=Streptomyces noursei TaxID=1971 RepID=A0A2N8PHU0_STRNR|nr:hypothetical protein [Streptomyces noursei]PNE40614.1 hypothetical protein AOB60_07055 [Streptomyces noursei]
MREPVVSAPHHVRGRVTRLTLIRDILHVGTNCPTGTGGSLARQVLRNSSVARMGSAPLSWPADWLAGWLCTG